MRRNGWHTIREDGRVTVARRLPARFDVKISEEFACMRMGRLAHQIRQDLWRELRGLRGFSPVILIESREKSLYVTAGGQVSGKLPKEWAMNKISALLANPDNRARWARHAQERQT